MVLASGLGVIKAFPFWIPIVTLELSLVVMGHGISTLNPCIKAETIDGVYRVLHNFALDLRTRGHFLMAVL